VRIAHDVTLLYLAVLLEETGDLFFAESRMDTSDKEVGARVAALIVIIPALWRRATAVAATWRGTAGARTIVATVTTRRPAAIALVAARLVIVAALFVFVLHGDDVVVGRGSC
jgi:hypothetical protein